MAYIPIFHAEPTLVSYCYHHRVLLALGELWVVFFKGGGVGKWIRIEKPKRQEYDLRGRNLIGRRKKQ